jgi:hypothetical protein
VHSPKFGNATKGESKMDLKVQKPFEKPDAGMFLGTIIDIATAEKVPTTFQGQVTLKDKVKLIWALTKIDGSPALNSEGKQFVLYDNFNASMHENSDLYKRVVQVLNAVPPLIEKTEQLEALLLGRSGQLFLVKAPNPKKPEDPYTNISGVAPLSAGQVPPTAPAGYVRVKDRPAKTFVSRGQAAATQPAPVTQAPVTQAPSTLGAPGQPEPPPTPAPVTGNVTF